MPVFANTYPIANEQAVGRRRKSTAAVNLTVDEQHGPRLCRKLDISSFREIARCANPGLAALGHIENAVGLQVEIGTFCTAAVQEQCTMLGGAAATSLAMNNQQTHWMPLRSGKKHPGIHPQDQFSSTELVLGIFNVRFQSTQIAQDFSVPTLPVHLDALTTGVNRQ